MPFPVAAAIGGAASIAGGIMGGKGAKKAAKTAAKAQIKIATMNNALAREQYSQNALRLDPYAYSGLQANNALMGLLLGSPASGNVTTPAPQTNPGGPVAPAGPDAQQQLEYLLYQSGDTIGPKRTRQILASGGTPEQKLAMALRLAKSGEKQAYGEWMQGQQAQQAMANSPFNQFQPNAVANNGGSAQSAWDQFRNSTNYQFRLNEGTKALNQGYAARGSLQSGAAQIALQERAQQFASNELGNYMNLLAQQQNVGMGAASALAGVGQNLVNNVTANNNNMAAAQANSALAQGQANQQMWGGIANGIGQIAGAFGSSYGNSPRFDYGSFNNTVNSNANYLNNIPFGG